MQLLVVAALLGCAAALQVEPKGPAPVERIVKLLTDMQYTLDRDGKEEARVYKKFACWCDKTAKSKAGSIETAQQEMRDLGRRILKLKGLVATRSYEITAINEQISAKEDEQAKLLTIRQKENGEWVAESAETKESMAGLEKAIDVLSTATNAGNQGKWDGGALLQSASAMESRNAVAQVLANLPTTMPRLHAKQISFLAEFSQGSSTYAPQSATIQGILGEMYATFSTTLEESTESEGTRNGSFEQLTEASDAELKGFKENRDTKKEEKAEAEAMLADATTAYDDTDKQLAADIAFFDVTKDGCTTKHSAFTTRAAARVEEAAGITQALNILTSDENKALFTKAIKPGKATSFLQIQNAPALLQDGVAVAAGKAYNVLKTQVRKVHSLRLAALAVQVRTVKAGHFAEVISAIDSMVTVVKQEGTDDAAKNKECVDYYHKNKLELARHADKIAKHKAKRDKMQGLIDQRKKEKTAVVAQLAEVVENIRIMGLQDTERHQAFETLKKNNEDAIPVLISAKDAMSKYYTDNGIEMGSITADVKGASLLQQAPSFSKKDNNKLEGQSILSLLASITEGLTNELESERQLDIAATADYLKADAAAKKLKKDLGVSETTLNGILAARRGTKNGEVQDVGTEKLEEKGVVDFQAEIQKDCDWTMSQLKARAAAREEELSGLFEAKAFLAGQTALISKVADKQELGGLRFLSMQ